MKRLSESIFNAGIKRNQGESIRKEDNQLFLSGLKILQNTEFINFGGLKWSQFNFGSEYRSEPGYFLSIYDIQELDIFLRKRGYRIANEDDFKNIKYELKECDRCYENGYRGRKLNVDDKEFSIFNFGYIPYDDEKGVGSVDNSVRYGGYNDEGNKIGITNILDDTSFFIIFKPSYKENMDDKVQVRVIKL